MKKLLFLFVLLPVLCAGCHHRIGAEIKGSGKRVVQKRDIGTFTSISTDGAFDVEVTCQKNASLEIEADDNILPFITTEIRGNVLYLKPTRTYSVEDSPKLKISVPNIEAFSANGAGKVEISGLNNEKFQISANGAPMITASGTTKMIGIDTNGAAKIDTHNRPAPHAVVDSKGVSKVDLGVSDQLDVTVSGPSRVTYKGDPVVNKTVHGPGKVEKRGDEGA